MLLQNVLNETVAEWKTKIAEQTQKVVGNFSFLITDSLFVTGDQCKQLCCERDVVVSFF